LAAIANIDDDIQRSETQLNDYYDQLSDLARRLSAERKQVATDLAESVEKELNG
jgi:DNA repair ATPase RecN